LIAKDTAFIDPAISEDFLNRFGREGIGSDRIICEVGENRDNYFSAYHRVDLGLDPFPFNGGTVNMESLWMGVPYVTLLGQDRISRRGAATLYKADLSGLVADSSEEYVEITSQLCTDLEELSKIRAGLRERVLSSRLFNGELMAKDLEQAFFGMWSEFLKRD
jgi:predicted O-linked N-acetylglucosamine transferase (SPINDLY family)